MVFAVINGMFAHSHRLKNGTERNKSFTVRCMLLK